VIPILLLIKILSPNYDVFCVLLSLSGFAFYMLGGHFLLKLCRETGYPEKDAYLLLILLFVFTLSGLTTGIASISASFVIISMWLYRREHITLSFVFLALATWAGYYPFLLFLTIFFIRLRRRELKTACREIVGYVLVSLPLLLMLMHLHLDEVPSALSYFGTRHLFDINQNAITMIALAAMYSTVLCILVSITMRREVSDIREYTLILLLTILFITILYPYGDRFWTVTVFMIFILSRMGSEPGVLRQREYATLIILGACVLICDHLVADMEMVCAAVTIFSLIVTVVLLTLIRSELGPMSELTKKK
jgi:hypothetical protein